MSSPVHFDGIDFTDSTDFTAFAREQLSNPAVTNSLPSDVFPLDWMFRAYDGLAGTPYRDRLAQGIAACLTAPEPFVRAQALIFFHKHPLGHGGERILVLIAGDRAAFRGVPNPIQPSIDLEWDLLRALGFRADAGDAHAAAVARAEILSPGQAEPLVASLSAVDPDWIATHAEEIVRASPGAAWLILYCLQGKRHDIGELGARLAPLASPEAEFRSQVERSIDDPAVRRRILAAIPPPSH